MNCIVEDCQHDYTRTGSDEIPVDTGESLRKAGRRMEKQDPPHSHFCEEDPIGQ